MDEWHAADVELVQVEVMQSAIDRATVLVNSSEKPKFRPDTVTDDLPDTATLL
jgi:hypothetical protein